MSPSTKRTTGLVAKISPSSSAEFRQVPSTSPPFAEGWNQDRSPAGAIAGTVIARGCMAISKVQAGIRPGRALHGHVRQVISAVEATGVQFIAGERWGPGGRLRKA
jgi:hypothetical protein